MVSIRWTVNLLASMRHKSHNIPHSNSSNKVKKHTEISKLQSENDTKWTHVSTCLALIFATFNTSGYVLATKGCTQMYQSVQNMSLRKYYTRRSFGAYLQSALETILIFIHMVCNYVHVRLHIDIWMIFPTRTIRTSLETSFRDAYMRR